MENFANRIIRAAKLDASLYEEVEADGTAMGQVVGVVILSAVAAGVGMITQGGAVGIVSGAIGAIVSWYVWAFLIYWIGTRLLPEPQTEADLGQLLRTIGFASAPGLIRVCGIIPALRGVVFLAASVWMLVAMVIAVRQALDYTSTGRAVKVCLIGWLVQVVITVVLFDLVSGRTI